jgi:hypothetical protein
VGASVGISVTHSVGVFSDGGRVDGDGVIVGYIGYVVSHSVGTSVGMHSSSLLPPPFILFLTLLAT